MATEVALATEELGNIVSAGSLFRHPKSYLPTHSTFHKKESCTLCIFADATLAECAEAEKKLIGVKLPEEKMQLLRSALRQRVNPPASYMPVADATLAECAEAEELDGEDFSRHLRMQLLRSSLRQRSRRCSYRRGWRTLPRSI